MLLDPAPDIGEHEVRIQADLGEHEVRNQADLGEHEVRIQADPEHRFFLPLPILQVAM